MTNQQMLILAVTVWEVIWKGFALWQTAQKREKAWFIFILVLNTAGVLPITYLLIQKYKKPKTGDESETVDAETAQ